MTTHSATVIGVFEKRDQAHRAVDDLRRAEFAENQIGMVSRDGGGAKVEVPIESSHTHWEEGAGIGAAAGALTGTGLGLAVAAGLIPGVGPVIVGGTLAALLASMGTGAAVGTVLGALVGMGVPEEEARYYEGEFNAGRTIVTVRADDRAPQAWEILSRHGAYGFEEIAAGTGLSATRY
jgi:hypothetical protein